MTKANGNKFLALVQLRSMLLDMERDLGLTSLSEAELDVYLAAHAASDGCGEVVTSDQIRHHALAANITQATYYRALGSLLKTGLLEKAPGHKTGYYIVRTS